MLNNICLMDIAYFKPILLYRIFKLFNVNSLQCIFLYINLFSALLHYFELCSLAEFIREIVGSKSFNTFRILRDFAKLLSRNLSQLPSSMFPMCITSFKCIQYSHKTVKNFANLKANYYIVMF